MARARITPRRQYAERRENSCASQYRFIRVKNIENWRIRNKYIKIRKIINQFKNTQVKHKGRVVRRMTVRCKSIYPAKKARIEY